MRVTIHSAVMILLVAFLLQAGQQPPQQFATVRLKVLDSYGQQRFACRVVSFRQQKPEGNAEYRDSFDGLVGSKIPFAFGISYSVLVDCADGSRASYPFVYVTHSEELLVLVSWTPRGDYVTGPEPRLAVSVNVDSRMRLTDQTWIKAVGVYTNDWEVAQVDPRRFQAGLFSIVPGRYLVLLLDGEKLICTQQIRFLREHAHLALSLSTEGCKAQGDSLLKVVQ